MARTFFFPANGSCAGTNCCCAGTDCCSATTYVAARLAIPARNVLREGYCRWLELIFSGDRVIQCDSGTSIVLKWDLAVPPRCTALALQGPSETDDIRRA